ncbi:DUF72 domain-containing protein [Brevibacillus fulvus]|uniref:Uncharacterized protein YecE (DUF72 family) n=1 Tax=Brevibacillus fulvus TaxID=1125967 RepID=A0A938Y2Z8_9BACL|nr:DUF72 domain-containing protein [Brevibacillus fulvus]MBM7591021.1 uncharacterized protein YecE (DUF72 family) [Brevibacillus fulvus]
MNKGNLQVGVCGWGDHDELYPQGVRDRDKLSVYASHFARVEIDSSFYAILPQKNYETWVRDTPDAFRFVVKAYQAMTGHRRGGAELEREEMFLRFAESIEPLRQAGKLHAVLFQFPPWFDCTKDHVQYLAACRQLYPDLPLAVEFRHQSWFSENYCDKTLQFLRQLAVTHVVCDEPQVPNGSVPIVVAVTEPRLALVRFHGRNTAGWRDPGKGTNWRDVRYLYNYSEAELQSWLPKIKQLQETADEVCILFNNNSGGDAVNNAKRLMQLLNIEPTGLYPRQMELF